MSVQPLVMVLLGGIASPSGPLIGAAVYKLLDTVITRYNRLLAARAGRDPGGAGARVPAGHRGRARRPATVSEPGTGPVLETRGLSKSFGGVRAVSSVDLAMPKGEIRALIGPNGAGKTTFFNMLTGQLRADAGSVLFKGERLSGLPPYAVWRRGVSRTFQITATFATLSALDNVRSRASRTRARPIPSWRRPPVCRRTRRARCSTRWGLVDQADRVAAVLAYGDLKKLELAVALANDPEVLLLDEPTAGMAPAERGALMALTERIARARGLNRALHRARHGRRLRGRRPHHGAPPGVGSSRRGAPPRCARTRRCSACTWARMA